MISEEDLERERHEARVKYERAERSRRRAAEEARHAAFEEGEMLGKLLGPIHLCQRRLGKPLTPAEELETMSPEDRERFAAALELELFGS